MQKKKNSVGGVISHERAIFIKKELKFPVGKREMQIVGACGSVIWEGAKIVAAGANAMANWWGELYNSGLFPVSNNCAFVLISLCHTAAVGKTSLQPQIICGNSFCQTEQEIILRPIPKQFTAVNYSNFSGAPAKVKNRPILIICNF